MKAPTRGTVHHGLPAGKNLAIVMHRDGANYLLLTVVLCLMGCLVGCTQRPAPNTFATPPMMAATEADSRDDARGDTDEPDIAMALTLPETKPSWQSPAPDGCTTLADLESLYAQAVQSTSEHDFDRAEDLLFVLQDQVMAPLPATADSNYVAHRRSLARRVYLLGGMMAETWAFAGETSTTDSLLTVAYDRLRRIDLPGSLRPATGTDLPPLTADLLQVDNSSVKRWVDYFCGRGRRHFTIWLQRKAAVDSLITTILVENDLPRELLYLAMIESGLSSRARSNVGAQGPWQFMPGTAKMFGLRRDWWVDERRDLEMSTRAAARYLRKLHDQFGNWALVLAAYNTGENRVVRQIRLTGHDDYWRLRLPLQTVNHIPKFIAAARIGEHPEHYGFSVSPRAQLSYDIVKVDDATDLDLIADCAGASRDALLALNPTLLRGATPPDTKAYPVRVPPGASARTFAALRQVPADRRLTWRRHRVERGETLSQIATSYGTTVVDLVRLNDIRDAHLIRPGDQLLIPMPARLAEKARSRAVTKGHYVPPDGYQRVSYKVQKGDTLGAIARELGVSVNHLRKVNGIYKSHLIYPGQKIYAYRAASKG